MNVFKTLKHDLPASVVVFFVALPLCLGIALTSGAPLFAGLIAGIVGGIVVASLSGSALGVSGPAAGLAVIVLNAINDLGSYENFLLAVVIAGVIQLILGVLKAGIIGYFFPSSVIKGMLTGIGVIIFLKQIPHVFGYDGDPEGDMAFQQVDGQNTLSELFNMLNFITPGAIVVSVVSLAILLFWELYLSKQSKIFKLIQGPLVVVIFGIVYHKLTQGGYWGLELEQLVDVPTPKNKEEFFQQFSLPNFSAIGNYNLWVVAITIAIVASLETLLSVEATDKLDPERRTTPTNRELFAQGAGNIVSGMIGGLPITQVIVRSSANIQSGGKSKLSAIIHGCFLLLAVILIPRLLNQIPVAALAAVLVVVGYKLAKPALFKKMFKLGPEQFIPFVTTVLGLVFTDLLTGVLLGLGVSIVVILIRSYQNSHFLHKNVEQGIIKIQLAEEVTFFNKATILRELDTIPQNAHLEIDVRQTKHLDHDVIEVFDDFVSKANSKNISVKLISERGIVENPQNYFLFFKQNLPLNA